MDYESENELCTEILCWHVDLMVHRLRRIPPEQWDWTFAPPAPTPRVLAAHAWQWLVCDRQHILESDARLHPLVPDPPADPQAMCGALQEESRRWRELILSLTPEQLAAPRRQFNDPEYAMNVRGFIGHIVQHCIYKGGQLATLYFALGLDGEAPYDAPFPNPIYADLGKADRP